MKQDFLIKKHRPLLPLEEVYKGNLQDAQLFLYSERQLLLLKTMTMVTSPSREEHGYIRRTDKGEEKPRANDKRRKK